MNGVTRKVDACRLECVTRDADVPAVGRAIHTASTTQCDLSHRRTRDTAGASRPPLAQLPPALSTHTPASIARQSIPTQV